VNYYLYSILAESGSYFCNFQAIKYKSLQKIIPITILGVSSYDPRRSCISLVQPITPGLIDTLLMIPNMNLMIQKYQANFIADVPR